MLNLIGINKIPIYHGSYPLCSFNFFTQVHASIIGTLTSTPKHDTRRYFDHGGSSVARTQKTPVNASTGFLGPSFQTTLTPICKTMSVRKKTPIRQHAQLV